MSTDDKAPLPEAVREQIEWLMKPDVGGYSPFGRLRAHLVGNVNKKAMVDRQVLMALMSLAGWWEAAAHQERALNGWLPIVTAPKTHDGLLLSDGKAVSQGGWLSQLDQGAEYEGQSGAPSPGWWSVDSIEPTHWMPLPHPPPTPEDR